VSVVRSAPLTHGQLSVLRSLAVHGDAGAAVANLVVAWEVPPGPDVAQTADAWLRLVRAHESLRTTFGRDAAGAFEQTVHTFTSPSLPVVELPEATAEEALRVAAELAAEPIDVARDLPWRAAVVTELGDPVHLVAAVHHVAADNDALRLLETAFYAALDGAEVVADGQPADLAVAQRSNARALAHWTAVWPSLDPADRDPHDRSPRRRASLYSPDALAAAKALSERLRVSIQSLVLSVGALAVARRERREQVTFVLMAANRIDPQRAGVVTSLNQYAPVTITMAGDVAPDDFLTAVYPACLTAYAHGSYDVDALATALAEAGAPDPDPTAFAKHFNFLGAVDVEPDAGSPLRSGVVWRGSTQRTGPNLHVAIAVGEGLLIGIGASEYALPSDGPAVLAAEIEAGLLRLADGGAAALSDVDLTPVRAL
jgi:hypothetical protein